MRIVKSKSLFKDKDFKCSDQKKSIQDGVIEGIIWSTGTTPISKADIEAKYSEVEAEWNAKKYYDVRQVSYPDIGDQLDDLYKQGAFSADMAAKIKKVKDDNPKG